MKPDELLQHLEKSGLSVRAQGVLRRVYVEKKVGDKWSIEATSIEELCRHLASGRITCVRHCGKKTYLELCKFYEVLPFEPPKCPTCGATGRWQGYYRPPGLDQDNETNLNP